MYNYTHLTLKNTYIPAKLIKTFLLFYMLICLACLGSFFLRSTTVSHIVLLTYIAYIFALYCIDTRFVFDYFWIIVSVSLNILGVWFCETQHVYLGELTVVTFPAGSLLPIVSCHILFFCSIEYYRSKKQIKIYMSENSNKTEKLMILMLDIGIVCLIILFLQVFRTPYFLTGLERIPYLQQYTEPWEQSLKSHMLMLIPIAGACGRKGYKKHMFAFMILLLVYYFWVGDKFGAYFLALYLFAISYLVDIKTAHLKKVVFRLAMVVISILTIVFIQRVLLFGDSVGEFWTYLTQRLAAQGEVWWSVYNREVGKDLRIKEFANELSAILPFSNVTKADSGQWKMLVVSSDYSAYSYYRVDIGVPYTSTTTASVFYYFKWSGLLVFYYSAAILYACIIQHFIDSARNYRILEMMISVKLISFSHALLTASDGYIFTYKGLVYIAALFLLIYLRRRKVKLIVKYESRCFNLI